MVARRVETFGEGIMYRSKVRPHLTRRITKIEYHDWLNKNLISYVDQWERVGECTEENFRRWLTYKGY
jgi:hypothetical protein